MVFEQRPAKYLSRHPKHTKTASIQGVSLPVLEVRVWYNPAS
jgi:hypothetical protein